MNKDNWKIRRRLMFVVVAFCMVIISYIIAKELDTGPAGTAVAMGFGVISSIVGYYVFGSVWDDNDTRKSK